MSSRRLRRFFRRRAEDVVIIGVAALLLSVISPRGPLSTAAREGSARPIRLLERPSTTPVAMPDPWEPGLVWMLSVSDVRRSLLDRSFGDDGGARLITASASGRYDGDGEFDESQRRARAAAAHFDAGARAVAVFDAEGLERGDVVVAVDGVAVRRVSEVRLAVRQWRKAVWRCRRCAGPLRVEVLRDGSPRTVTIPPPVPRQRAVTVAVEAVPSMPLPPVGAVGRGRMTGGSAGLAFVVAYLDHLAGGDLLNGHRVAATGVLLRSTGRVGGVGGIADKLAAADAARAEVVFVPAENLAEIPERYRSIVVGVDDVADVLDWLCAKTATSCAAFAIPG